VDSCSTSILHVSKKAHQNSKYRQIIRTIARSNAVYVTKKNRPFDCAEFHQNRVKIAAVEATRDRLTDASDFCKLCDIIALVMLQIMQVVDDKLLAADCSAHLPTCTTLVHIQYKTATVCTVLYYSIEYNVAAAVLFT